MSPRIAIRRRPAAIGVSARKSSAAVTAHALVAVGERGRWIAEAAAAAGMALVSHAADADEAASVLERDLAPGPGDVVLLKASRGIGLDRTVELLAGPRT